MVSVTKKEDSWPFLEVCSLQLASFTKLAELASFKKFVVIERKKEIKTNKQTTKQPNKQITTSDYK